MHLCIIIKVGVIKRDVMCKRDYPLHLQTSDWFSAGDNKL